MRVEIPKGDTPTPQEVAVCTSLPRVGDLIKVTNVMSAK